jgi:excinuclease UvrABC nuclease subunit
MWSIRIECELTTPDNLIRTIPKNLPLKPGFHLMKVESGKGINVGKAKKLRNRVHISVR